MFGFHVVNQSGERIASAEHIDEALLLMRLLPSAHEVLRASDGVSMATVKRFKARKVAFRLTTFEWAVA